MSTQPGPPTGRVHATPQGRQLIIERTFRASIEEVWAGLTEPERVARWYGTIDGDQLPGQTIMITMTAEEGAPCEPARIIECDPPNRFLIETAGMGEPWRLHVELGEANGVTTMTFTHALADALDAAEIGPGWEFYADRHNAVFEGNAMPDWAADRYQELLGPHYEDRRIHHTTPEVDAYIAGVPDRRRPALERLRALCVETLGGYEELLDYGMPGYRRVGDEIEVAFASQARYISIYIMRKDVLDRYRAALTTRDVGKGCIRYANPDKIDYDVVRSILVASAAATGPIC